MNTTKRLTMSAMLVALGTLLSLIVLYKLPYGGSITAFSMLPVCVLAYMYGIKWGLLGGLAFGVTQLIIGGVSGGSFAAMELWDFIFMLILDYLLAYTCLGLTPIFKGKLKSGRLAFALGICVASSARLAAHTLSGYILFRGWAEWFFTDMAPGVGTWVLASFHGEGLYLFYGLFYNAAFLVPEAVLTVVAGTLIFGQLRVAD